MSLNKVQLIGRVGQEPAVKYFESNQAVATFTLATTERGYTMANGTHKGDLLYLEGKIRSRQYDDQNGVHRTRVEIFVDNMELLSPKNNAQQPAAAVPQPAPVQPEEPTSTDGLPF